MLLPCADALKAKFSNQQAFGALSHGEQAAALSNPDPFVLEELAALNKAYKAKHGFIFIICASGKSAQQMLTAIKQRLPNAPYTELGSAAREQMKITELRLEKLLSSQVSTATNSGGGNSPAERAAVRTGQLAGHFAPAAPPPPAAAAAAAAAGSHRPLRSPITTHVLDTTLGRPAQGLPISLHRLMDGSHRMWDCLASGLTDADGRIGNLLAPAGWVAPGVYQMRFDTDAYLRACRWVTNSAWGCACQLAQAVLGRLDGHPGHVLAPWRRLGQLQIKGLKSALHAAPIAGAALTAVCARCPCACAPKVAQPVRSSNVLAAACSSLYVFRDAHPDVFRSVPFYPEAVIEFTITPEMSSQHFHIPLLLNPYGYSTYRGS
jgi:5-hydroxyisourate hydrolase-like protein (transthyretin family)